MSASMAGGAEAEYVVDYLRRRLLSYWAASVQILFWFDIAHIKRNYRNAIQ